MKNNEEHPDDLEILSKEIPYHARILTSESSENDKYIALHAITKAVREGIFLEAEIIHQCWDAVQSLDPNSSLSIKIVAMLVEELGIDCAVDLLNKINFQTMPMNDTAAHLSAELKREISDEKVDIDDPLIRSMVLAFILHNEFLILPVFTACCKKANIILENEADEEKKGAWKRESLQVFHAYVGAEMYGAICRKVREMNVNIAHTFVTNGYGFQKNILPILSYLFEEYTEEYSLDTSGYEIGASIVDEDSLREECMSEGKSPIDLIRMLALEKNASLLLVQKSLSKANEMAILKAIAEDTDFTHILIDVPPQQQESWDQWLADQNQPCPLKLSDFLIQRGDDKKLRQEFLELSKLGFQWELVGTERLGELRHQELASTIQRNLTSGKKCLVLEFTGNFTDLDKGHEHLTQGDEHIVTSLPQILRKAGLHKNDMITVMCTERLIKESEEGINELKMRSFARKNAITLPIGIPLARSVLQDVKEFDDLDQTYGDQFDAMCFFAAEEDEDDDDFFEERDDSPSPSNRKLMDVIS